MKTIINEKITNDLKEIVGCENVKTKEPMSKHTTFRVGGEADYFVIPSTKEEVSSLIKYIKSNNLPYFVLGNGSNLLVSDKGYRGIVIWIYKNFSNVYIEGNRVYSQAGASLKKVATEAYNNSLKEFEFASGIPGTFGGACVMNAGAYGGEMVNVLESVEVVDDNGCIRKIEAKDLELGYRTSIIKKKNYIVLEGVIKLEKGNKNEIKALMDELTERRVSKQPLEFPSAGSTFKRPEGYFAGKLIMDSDLRGFTYGGAMVSTKHCGFVINHNNGTAEDVLGVIRHVQKTVKEKFGVELETEVKFLGEF